MVPLLVTFSTSFMAGFKSIVGLMAGTAAVRQTNRLIRNVRMALIAVVAVSIICFVCLLVITVYFGMQIVQMIVQ